MAGVAWAVSTFDWVDPGRVAALGASYGGYMMNWINGHTDRYVDGDDGDDEDEWNKCGDDNDDPLMTFEINFISHAETLPSIPIFTAPPPHPPLVRFKCLVAHGAIFSLRNLYFTTEELW